MSEHNDFRVEFPYHYTIEVDTAQVAIGALPITKVFCREGLMDSLSVSYEPIYFLSITEYPEATFPRDSIDLMEYLIDQSTDHLRAEDNLNLDYSATLDKENYFAKILRMSSNIDKSEITRAKYIVYKDYFIVLQVRTRKNNKHFRKAEDFLNSFKPLNL